MTSLHQTDLIQLRPLQFSIRRAIAVGILMAVLFVVIGPWLRQFDPQVVAIVIGAWVVAVAIFGGVLGFGSIYFRGVLERAGPILCVLPREGHLRDCLLFTPLYILQILVALYCTGISIEAFGHRYETSVAPPALTDFVLFVILLWLVAFSLAGSTIFLLRSEYSAICENGMIHVAVFVRWRRVRGDRWQTRGDRTSIAFRSRWLKTWKFEVAADDREEVENLLTSVRGKYSGGETN